jgi:hypothetical protein
MESVAIGSHSQEMAVSFNAGTIQRGTGESSGRRDGIEPNLLVHLTF